MHVDTPGFGLKTNLSSLKTEIDKLDINKLVPVPSDLSKFSNVVKNDVVKKAVYNKLVAKVDNIDTSRFILKNKYDTDKTILGSKIPDTSNLVKKADYNSKITEIEDITPYISNLATKTALTTVENKILDISNLVKKSDNNTKISDIENNVKKLQAYDLSYSRGKQYFDEEDGKQNYLVFLPKTKYFKLNLVVNVTDRVLSWQSKGISYESIKAPATSNNSLNPRLSYYGTKTRVQFIGNCLKQPNFTFTHKKVVNIYIAYELGASSSNFSDPTIQNCLFGAVTLT